MTVMDQTLYEMGQQAKQAARVIRRLDPKVKDEALHLMAEAFKANYEEILKANQKDIEAGRGEGLTEALIERLSLDEATLDGIHGGLLQVANLQDPTRLSDSQFVNEQGLRISRRRVPLGVIAMIYESRPNVTVDASALCLKAGNAVILRGGREAMNSNKAIMKALQEGLAKSQVPVAAIQLITNPSRQVAAQLMTYDDAIDCLIPRGGAGLIQAVLRQATVPVIETGEGNGHLYIHQDAEEGMAVRIVMNAKVQRPSVCNAIETLLVDRAIADRFIPVIVNDLQGVGVEIRGDETVQALADNIVPVTAEDYATEFLDNVLALRVVDNYAQAVDHIEEYSTAHSDGIVTNNYAVSQEFLNDVDSAAVYVNASTRFSDGEIFGLGAEIGISTQKLHARGPMGLEALTSYKYVVEGQGQVRE